MNKYMVLSLSNLGKKKKSAKRLGRGNASGHGTYSTRGQKGQRARSGGGKGLKLKGFKQNLLNMPKYKGMKSPRSKAQVVLISTLDKNFKDKEQVTPGSLFERGLIASMKLPIKILTKTIDDKLEKLLEITGCGVSASACRLIEKAGGQVVNLDDGKVTDKVDKK